MSSRVAPQDHEEVVIGKRPSFSPVVRARVFEREHGVCYLCTGKIKAGEAWDLEHRNQRSISNDDSEPNLFPVHRDKPECHPEKTKNDAGIRAKVKRIEYKHKTPREQWKRSSPPLKGRGFARRWSKIEDQA